MTVGVSSHLLDLKGYFILKILEELQKRADYICCTETHSEM